MNVRLTFAVLLSISTIITQAQQMRPKRYPTVHRKTAAPISTPIGSSGLNFQPVVTYDAGGTTTYSVAVADMNNDGNLDVVVANYCASSANCTNGSVGVLLANGDGTFQPATTFSSGGQQANTVAIGDVNGDGNADVVVANYCQLPGNGNSTQCGDGSVSVLLGNGDGTLQAPVSYDTGGYLASSLALADLNSDGKLDIVVANTCVSTANCKHGAAAVLLNRGNGTFSQAVEYGIENGYTAYSVQVADVNEDGRFDLVVVANNVNYAGAVSVLLGNGDGSFGPPVTYSTGDYFSYSVAVADLNGDEKPDLIVTNDCADFNCNYGGQSGVLIGNGDGTFQPVFLFGGGDTSVTLGDVNGDNKTDAIALGPQVVQVQLGQGDGTFLGGINLSPGGVYGVSLAAADLNRDGKLDIVVANECVTSSCSGDGSVGILINASVPTTLTALLSSVNPSGAGQSVTFSAEVTSHGPGTPTGTVMFMDGAIVLGTSVLSSDAVAAFSTSTLAVGTHSVTALYGGDSNFAPSTSSAVAQLVQGSVASVSPNTLQFGNQTVGTNSAAQSVTLTNTGNTSLQIATIGISGPNPTDFAATNTCSASLLPGSSCTINVTFKPRTSGTRTAALTVSDNAVGSPQSVSLAGSGVRPAVTLAPTSISFPTQLVFTTSKAKSVTLTNIGLGTLYIAKIMVTGPFTQTTACSSTLNPGTSCSFTVVFKPTSIGPLAGSISISDNAPQSPQSITLGGIGTYIMLTPAGLSFGNQPVGTTSLRQKITLSNKGSVAVSISSISITGTNPSDFEQTNNCGTTLAAGSSCFIGVTFTPTAAGPRHASVSVSDNGGGSPQKVALGGTGT